MCADRVFAILGYGRIALGAATALMGEKAAMARTAAVEMEIYAYYAAQLAELEAADAAPELREKIEAFRADEVEHAKPLLRRCGTGASLSADDANHPHGRRAALNCRKNTDADLAALRLQLVPIEIILPAFMAIIGRETPSIFMQFIDAGLARFIARKHACLFRHPPAFRRLHGEQAATTFPKLRGHRHGAVSHGQRSNLAVRRNIGRKTRRAEKH